MIVLGIETSTDVSSIALGRRDGIVASRLLATGRRHVEFLMPAILAQADETGIALDRVNAVAVGIGPGFFTGMRVGITTAKTIGQLLHVPVVGVSSLDLLAFGVRYSPRLICACIDAKRGEVFSALYRHAPAGVQRIGDYRAWSADALLAELVAAGEDVLFVGTGALAYREVLGRLEGSEFASTGLQVPRAELLVELAVPRVEREDFPPVAQLEPLYVRRSDAEIKWEERGVVIERPFRVKVSKNAGEDRTKSER